MKKSDYKTELHRLLDAAVDGMTFDQQMAYTEELVLKYQIKNDTKRSSIENKGKSWTDDQLRIILSAAPSKSNCIKYARLFQRGYGSIEQIYRWSTTTQQDIDEVRPDDKFIAQIKRIAKELGLRG